MRVRPRLLNADLRSGDALLPTRRVKQERLPSLFEDKRIPNLPHPAIHIPRLRRSHRQVRTLITRFGPNDLDGRSRSPGAPIRREVQRRNKHAFRRITDGSKEDLQAVAASYESDVPDPAGV